MIGQPHIQSYPSPGVRFESGQDDEHEPDENDPGQLPSVGPGLFSDDGELPDPEALLNISPRRRFVPPSSSARRRAVPSSSARRRAVPGAARQKAWRPALTSDADYYGKVIALDIGQMDRECPRCGARVWAQERTGPSTVRRPQFRVCCLDGQVIVPPLTEVPQYLIDLLRDQTPTGKQFRSRIRGYNSNLAFASVRVTLNEDFIRRTGTGIYCYRIQGQMYHRIGGLEPDEDGPKFAQIYMLPDHQEQIDRRQEIVPDLSPIILAELQEMLLACNPYAQIYQTAGEQLRNDPSLELRIGLRNPNDAGYDARTYNQPVVDEVAAILIGEQADGLDPREIRVLRRTGDVNIMNDLHQGYISLSYPLIEPYGRKGWHPGLLLADFLPDEDTSASASQVDGAAADRDSDVSSDDGGADDHADDDPGPRAGSQRKRMHLTRRMWAAYHLFVRGDQRQAHFLSERLWHALLVDWGASIEGANLDYLRRNQDALRADLYQGVADAFHQGDHDGANLGKRIVLPSSCKGSPRQMQQLYQDAIAIVSSFGKPDYFITMTCNPNWPEIRRELLPGQTANDRPELVSRVFHMKMKKLLADLRTVLGKPLGMVHVVEYQKRGLPHCHILLIVDSPDKPFSADDVDRVVEAVIPNAALDPELHAKVVTHMVHGPCGRDKPRAACMTDGKCSKNFPKPCCGQTYLGRDAFPEYRRPEGPTAVKGTRTITNADIVPYNRFLLLKYDCHINVEICNTVAAVKYLYKYVYKGHDRALFEIRGEGQNDGLAQPGQDAPNVVDEIAQYVDARYIAAHEAVGIILGLPRHRHYPTVYRLQLHLPNQQPVVFREGELHNVIDQANFGETTLTAFFKMCATDADARQYSYIDMPRHYTFDKKKKIWVKRRRKGAVIGRMYYVTPSSGEKFHLRRLLLEVNGPTSFADLRTVDGVTYETFRLASLAMGLLQGNDEWDHALTEAAQFRTGSRLRDMFALILLSEAEADAPALWDAHKVSRDRRYSEKWLTSPFIVASDR